MKLKNQKLISSLLALALSMGSFTALNIASASEDAYIYVEDFEDGYNNNLVQTSTNVSTEVVTDSATGSSVAKFTGVTGADNWLYIYPDKAIEGEPLVEDRTGKAIIEFDYMSPRNYNTGVFRWLYKG